MLAVGLLGPYTVTKAQNIVYCNVVLCVVVNASGRLAWELLGACWVFQERSGVFRDVL